MYVASVIHNYVGTERVAGIATTVLCSHFSENKYFPFGKTRPSRYESYTTATTTYYDRRISVLVTNIFKARDNIVHRNKNNNNVILTTTRILFRMPYFSRLLYRIGRVPTLG